LTEKNDSYLFGTHPTGGQALWHNWQCSALKSKKVNYFGVSHLDVADNFSF